MGCLRGGWLWRRVGNGGGRADVYDVVAVALAGTSLALVGNRHSAHTLTISRPALLGSAAAFDA